LPGEYCRGPANFVCAGEPTSSFRYRYKPGDEHSPELCVYALAGSSGDRSLDVGRLSAFDDIMVLVYHETSSDTVSRSELNVATSKRQVPTKARARLPGGSLLVVALAL